MSSKKSETYDIVLANGRVIDPETYLDGQMRVGIKGDRIVAVSETPLKGKCACVAPWKSMLSSSVSNESLLGILVAELQCSDARLDPLVERPIRLRQLEPIGLRFGGRCYAQRKRHYGADKCYGVPSECRLMAWNLL